MSQNSCNIYTSKLCETRRKTKNDKLIYKEKNEIHITFCEEDSLEKFENDLNKLRGNSFIYFLKKRFSSTFISTFSVLIILFALIAVSIYEDLLKKIIFTLPFPWSGNDSISLLFVLVFFFGLILMPSLLDAEGSEFKTILSSWFNKDIRKLKRLELGFSLYDKKTTINLYNFDLESEKHWTYRLLLKILISRFYIINLYIRNDKIQSITKKLEALGALNIVVIKSKQEAKNESNSCDIDFLLSNKEQKLYSLMQLSSLKILENYGNKRSDKKVFISLELFEYCGRNFFEESKDSKNQLISGFQNFINRSFDDFNFIAQEKSMQTYFTNKVKFKDLEDEQKRLSYYLRNHIEDCIVYFANPISLLVLFYYVKDIVLDEKRIILILEKFIEAIDKKQQYKLIDDYWFDIAGEMFDSTSLDSFDKDNNSFYRKLSIKSLDKLIFLFERNGHFHQAVLLCQYLYEINPNKYSITICSLYERMGQFDKAYASLPLKLNLGKNKKPSDIEIRYFQRKAWIIVSQRKENLKEVGLDSLESLRELIFSHNENNDPLCLWHYYNIKANYFEWDSSYDLSIQNYKKCLSIPTLGAFEYGATFVNMAIAYRLKYLTSNTQNLDIIDKSIRLGKLGVILKESVGDRDEIPVVLHNQALNVLSKMLNCNQNDIECKEIINITNEAILILDKTKSIKRLGMLLIENYIARCLLNEDTSIIVNRLKNHLELLDENEYKQLLSLYKEFLKVDKIKSLDFLDQLI
ncbi:hypothetical protein [Poseidonibacter antarcticus]|uniref:hypothetical protein n=1 Tax=Poseidonibacter antarcticus TaxID=2478538 RepID=UPI000EF44E4F|nr:hypothetical protein [Poseidonibacter antarcticus]